MRVGCARRVSRDEIVLLGYGELYRRRKPLLGTGDGEIAEEKCPTVIRLDSGAIIPAQRCWWAPAEKFERMMKRLVRAGADLIVADNKQPGRYYPAHDGGRKENGEQLR